MATLIVAEKPNVAKKIANSFGKTEQKKKGRITYFIIPDKDIYVASAVGHLYTLRQARPIDTYPFFDIKWMPIYEFNKNMAYLKNYIDVLFKLAEKTDEIINACDYDLEGSVIGFNTIKYACKKDPRRAKRMKFSTLTADELISSYEKREKTLNFPMVESGLTRHELDWYWGMNTSKALSTSVKRKNAKYITLSAGRVQTPTLYFITEREKEIAKFIPTPYWLINIYFEKEEQKVKASYPKKITDQKKADKIFGEINGRNGIVAEFKKTKSHKKTPPPMDLGLLQTEAWANFNMLPKKTQDVAQALYEAGLISYPRTSSQKLPSKLNFKKILKNLKLNAKYNKAASEVLLTSLRPVQGKKDDPAHPAIYPTGLATSNLPKDQEKLYDLIVNRFFAVFMPDAIVENVTLVVDVSGHSFVAKGQQTVEEGWMRYYGKYARKGAGPLPEFAVGEKIVVADHKKTKKMTKPPPRYNPASVIKEMENLGIGTKATRANIVDTLYQRGYIKGREIHATDIGQKLIITLEKFCGKIVSVELTKHFEQEIEQVLSGKKKKKDVLNDAKAKLREILAHFREHEKEIGSELILALKNSTNEEVGKCPACGSDLKIVVSKTTNKRFVGCKNYPKCKTSYPLPQKGAVTFTDKKCPKCGAPMIKIKKWKRCININCSSKENKNDQAR
ncbi:MAG: DNA topoisomerase I [Candidatus Methanofastidiosia archaeon]